MIDRLMKIDIVFRFNKATAYWHRGLVFLKLSAGFLSTMQNSHAGFEGYDLGGALRELSR